MRPAHWLILAACLVLPCLECANAHADEPVDAGMVCRLQEALRWRERAWSPSTCERVADALNATSDPRTMLAIAINESDMRERVMRLTELPDGRLAFDVGLCGVRCVTYPGDDRCINGPARGLYVHQLLDPVINIRAAEAVLQTKTRLGEYNARTSRLVRRYENKIAVLATALAGGIVDQKKLRRKKRLRDQVAKIHAALREPQS